MYFGNSENKIFMRTEFIFSLKEAREDHTALMCHLTAQNASLHNPINCEGPKEITYRPHDGFSVSTETDAKLLFHLLTFHLEIQPQMVIRNTVFNKLDCIHITDVKNGWIFSIHQFTVFQHKKGTPTYFLC